VGTSTDWPRTGIGSLKGLNKEENYVGEEKQHGMRAEKEDYEKDRLEKTGYKGSQLSF